MEMINMGFNSDMNFSKKCQPLFDEYYKTELFKSILQKLRLKGKVEIERIDRSENVLFQTEAYLDAIIVLSCGSSLKIDEKVVRSWKPEYDQFPIEVWSNPNKGGKHDGSDYHIGTTIIRMPVDQEGTKMIAKPIVYNVTNQYIDEVVRNSNYPARPNKSTDGLYCSGYKYIPRAVFDKYFP
jgi:hypothetical protein